METVVDRTGDDSGVGVLPLDDELADTGEISFDAGFVAIIARVGIGRRCT